jgi:putative hydrolase of the HAD superfamily
MKAVLFDLFGTLVDNPTTAEVSQLHQEVASVLGVPADDYAKGWKATFHDRAQGKHGSVAQSIAAAATMNGSKINQDAIPRAVEIRYEFTRSWLTLRTDAFSTVSELKNRGLKIGLLSNCTDEVPEIWPSLNIAPMFDEPLFSSQERLRKPLPEFYHRALGRLNVAASDCLYVADGDNGELAAAEKLGMPGVMIRPPDLLNDYRQDPEEDWDGLRIERLSELLHLEILNQTS